MLSRRSRLSPTPLFSATIYATRSNYGPSIRTKNWVVLENSNMAKLASNQYLSVQSRLKEDRYDINDASSGEVYSVFVSESSLRTIQSSRRREHRPSVVDRQTPAHRTTAMHGLHPGVLRTGRHLDGPQQAA